MFEISHKVYTSMFSLPTEIADRELKFANGDQLKVILCIFRNPSVTNEEISSLTNLSILAVKDAVEYWISTGILKDNSLPEKEKKPIKADDEKPRMPLPEITFTNPNQAEIEKILKKNGSVKRLFNEAQEILGRTLGYSMQCTIYSVVYRYGIKPDVANCLLHFARSIDSTSQNEILKIAKYWAENGITDMAAADDYIQETGKALEVFRELAVRTNNDTSVPTFAVLELFCEWIRWGYGIDEIEKAFEIMKAEKQTGRLVWNNICHMNGTIKNWHKTGATTVETIEKGTEKFKTASKKKIKPKETSFDVEKAEKQARENRKRFGDEKYIKTRKKDGKGA